MSRYEELIVRRKELVRRAFTGRQQLLVRIDNEGGKDS